MVAYDMVYYRSWSALLLTLNINCGGMSPIVDYDADVCDSRREFAEFAFGIRNSVDPEDLAKFFHSIGDAISCIKDPASSREGSPRSAVADCNQRRSVYAGKSALPSALKKKVAMKRSDSDILEQFVNIACSDFKLTDHEGREAFTGFVNDYANENGKLPSYNVLTKKSQVFATKALDDLRECAELPKCEVCEDLVDTDIVCVNTDQQVAIGNRYRNPIAIFKSAKFVCVNGLNISPDHNWKQTFPNVEYILFRNIAPNDAKDFKIDVKDVKLLDISHNALKGYIPDYEGIENFVSTGNKFTQYYAMVLQSLRKINFSENMLESIFSSRYECEEMDLSNNNISNIEQIKLPNIVNLNLSGNTLSSKMIAKLVSGILKNSENLTVLDLGDQQADDESGNEVALNFSSMHKLEKLYLDRLKGKYQIILPSSLKVLSIIDSEVSYKNNPDGMEIITDDNDSEESQGLTDSPASKPRSPENDSLIDLPCKEESQTQETEKKKIEEVAETKTEVNIAPEDVKYEMVPLPEDTSNVSIMMIRSVIKQNPVVLKRLIDEKKITVYENGCVDSKSFSCIIEELRTYEERLLCDAMVHAKETTEENHDTYMGFFGIKKLTTYTKVYSKSFHISPSDENTLKYYRVTTDLHPVYFNGYDRYNSAQSFKMKINGEYMAPCYDDPLFEKGNADAIKSIELCNEVLFMYLFGFATCNASKLKTVVMENVGMYFVSLNLVQDLNLVEEVNFSNNMIQWLPPHLPQLEKLSNCNFSRNEIPIFIKEIVEMKSLQHLNLSRNQIHTIESGKSSTINYLDLSYNKLNCFDISQFEVVKTVNLSHNALKELVIKTSEVEVLDCSYNNLEKVTIIGIKNLSICLTANPDLKIENITINDCANIMICMQDVNITNNDTFAFPCGVRVHAANGYWIWREFLHYEMAFTCQCNRNADKNRANRN